MGEICIVHEQQVDKCEIGSICHFIDDSLECRCHSAHCDCQDWFLGYSKCWKPLRWSDLDLPKPAGCWIQSLQRIPLWIFIDHPRIVVLHHIDLLFNCILPQNWLWQPQNNLLSQQFAFHACCHWGKSHVKTHFICHYCSWYIWLPDRSPHNKPYRPHLVHQKLGSG